MNDGLNGILVGILRDKAGTLFISLAVRGGTETVMPIQVAGEVFEHLAVLLEQVGYFDDCEVETCETKH